MAALHKPVLLKSRSYGLIYSMDLSPRSEPHEPHSPKYISGNINRYLAAAAVEDEYSMVETG
jgi:hypothetical protein